MQRRTKIILGLSLITLFVWVGSFYQNPYQVSEMMTLEAPSFRHILGTDNLGRDIFSRLVLGSFYSMSIAFLAVLFAGVVGGFLGGLAGYFEGYLDEFLLFLSETLRSEEHTSELQSRQYLV